jgi:hypothetical protein
MADDNREDLFKEIREKKVVLKKVNRPRSKAEYGLEAAELQREFIKPIKTSVLSIKDIFNKNNNELDIRKVNKLCDENLFNFVGVGSLTDFYSHELCQKSSLNLNVIRNQFFNNLMLKDCPYATIWSLYYLFKIGKKNLFEAKTENLGNLVTGCDLISENLIASLTTKTREYKNEEKYFNEAKLVIINDENDKSSNNKSLINRLAKKKDEARNFVFDYFKLNGLSNKTLNIYECSEVKYFLFLLLVLIQLRIQD